MNYGQSGAPRVATGPEALALNVVRLDAPQFSDMSADERVLLIGVGHMVNEATMLNKWLVWSLSNQVKSPVESQVAGFQSLFIGRLLAGKLYEAKVCLDKLFSRELAKEYGDRMTGRGRDAISCFRRYFKRDSLVEIIRKKFAFHYDAAQLKSVSNELVSASSAGIVLGAIGGNTFHVKAELAANTALLRLIDPEDFETALAKFVDEVHSVLGQFLTFSDEVVYAILKKYVPELTEVSDALHVEVRRSMSEIDLPFFIREIENSD